MQYTISDYDNILTLKKMYVQKHIPKLYHIYIETTNYCNYNCSFCPTGQGKRIESKHIMSMAKYMNLINMLSKSSLIQNIKISLYGNNEPLLDPTIIDKINYLKKCIPTTYVYLSTNGLLLEQYIDSLYKSNIDCIYIQAYTEKIYKDICSLLSLKKYNYGIGKYTTNFKDKIYIVPRFDLNIDYTYTYINRAGQAYTVEHIPNMCCICPFVDIYINSFGGMQMCTFDALGETIFDNIFNYNTLEAAWFSNNYKIIRTNMLKNGKFGFDVCKRCDIPNNEYRLYFYIS